METMMKQMKRIGKKNFLRDGLRKYPSGINRWDKKLFFNARHFPRHASMIKQLLTGCRISLSNIRRVRQQHKARIGSRNDQRLARHIVLAIRQQVKRVDVMQIVRFQQTRLIGVP